MLYRRGRGPPPSFYHIVRNAPRDAVHCTTPGRTPDGALAPLRGVTGHARAGVGAPARLHWPLHRESHTADTGKPPHRSQEVPHVSTGVLRCCSGRLEALSSEIINKNVNSLCLRGIAGTMRHPAAPTAPPSPPCLPGAGIPCPARVQPPAINQERENGAHPCGRTPCINRSATVWPRHTGQPSGVHVHQGARAGIGRPQHRLLEIVICAHGA